MEDFSEGWTTGLFEDMSEAEAAVKSMTAMLNRFNKATIVIGVDKNGDPSGIRLSNADAETFRRIMSSKMNRIPETSITLEDDGDSHLMIVRATG